jgi:hypothetical protein
MLHVTWCTLFDSLSRSNCLCKCLHSLLLVKAKHLNKQYLFCRVRVLCPDCHDQLRSISNEAQALELIQQHGSSELGFLQFFNLHRSQRLLAGEAPGTNIDDVWHCCCAVGPLLSNSLQQCLGLSKPWRPSIASTATARWGPL